MLLGFRVSPALCAPCWSPRSSTFGGVFLAELLVLKLLSITQACGYWGGGVGISPTPALTSGPPLAVAYVLQLFNLGLERWFWLEASGMRRKAQLMSAGVALLTSCEQHYKEQPVASPLVLPRQQLL